MELNKKLNQKCKAQIIEYLNQTSKIRNAVQMQLIHLSSKNLSNPTIEGKIKNDWNRIEYSRSPRMISIEYLRKIFKKKKIRKRVSLKLPLVPSSLFKSHLEFFTPPRNFFVLGRPQDTHRYEAHKNYNSFLPLLRKERRQERKYREERRASSIDSPVLRSISTPRHFWIINPLITTRGREEEEKEGDRY